MAISSGSNDCYWQVAAGSPIHLPYSKPPRQIDFAVIGGGFSGLATAVAVQRQAPGATVAVFEAARVGAGASGKSAGFLSPVAAPFWLLQSARSKEAAWGAGFLYEEMHHIATFLGSHFPSVELAPSTLRLLANGILAGAGLQSFQQATEIANLPSTISRDSCNRLVVSMNAYALHPYQLVLALANYAQAQGVFVCENSAVAAIDVAAGAPRVSLQSGAEFIAGKVIVCTNAYSDGLDLKETTRALPLHTFLMASTPMTETDLENIIDRHSFGVEVNSAQCYFRRHGSRLLYGGFDKLSASWVASTLKHLQKRMDQSFPALGRVPVAHFWSGKIHATPTGLPIIRASRNSAAVLFNLGYGGTGTTLALVCARAVAGLAIGTFVREEDARLLALIQSTRVTSPDVLSAIAKIAVRAALRPSIPRL
jgi:glycine/D-amino acid oxidase-like deaminating enzyme